MNAHQSSRLGLLLTLVCLIGMLSTACGNPFTNPFNTQITKVPTIKPPKAPASQQIYRQAIQAPDIATFDPAQAADTSSLSAISLVFTGMVQFDDMLQVKPQMAQSYDKSSDGLTYTFHLRTGLQFSDGTSLTSKDVAYSLDRALSPAVSNLTGLPPTYLGLLKDAPARTQGKVATLINDSILTPDEHTVILKLSKPAGYFLAALAYPTAYVVEKSVIEQWSLKWTDHLADNGGQGGDGPFKVKSYIHARSIILVPNPNYYGPRPQLNEVDQVFYPLAQTSYDAYLAHELDYTAIPVANYPEAQHSKEFHKVPDLAIDYITMNYLQAPFNNIKVRQAFALALNKDAIVKGVWQGAYNPTCHIVPYGMSGYNRQLRCPASASTSGDAVKAKQLFNEGLREERWTLATLPPIKIVYAAGSPELTNEITTVTQMWQNVLGVTIETQAMAYPQLINAESNTTGNAHGLQIWVSSWGADYPDPQDWLTLQFGDGQAFNESNYGNNHSSDADQQKQTQQAMDAADVMTDAQARLQVYNRAEQQVVNDVAWLPLFQRSDLELRKSFVFGFMSSLSASTPPDDWANIYISSH